MPRPSTTTKHLRHDFTPDELAELGAKLADQYDEHRNIEEELNAVKADFKERTLCAEREIGRLSRLIKARFDMRGIECRYEWNKPDSGVVQIVRIDTGELVQERPMSDDERQEELPLEAPTAEAPTEATTEAPAQTAETVTDESRSDDELYGDAVALVREFGKASTSLLQRRLRVGYGRSAHLIDLMEQRGVVGAANGAEPRAVLPPTEQQQAAGAAD